MKKLMYEGREESLSNRFGQKTPVFVRPVAGASSTWKALMHKCSMVNIGEAKEGQVSQENVNSTQIG